MNSLQFETKCMTCGKNDKLLPEIQTKNDFIELSCDHSYCCKCFSDYCNFFMNKPDFSKPQDLICPKCQKPINIFYLLPIFHGVLFEEYRKKCWNSFEPKKNELCDRDCGGNDQCDYDDRDCGGNNQCDYDQCCNENECKPEENKKSDTDLNADFMIKNDFKECPVCGVYIEKIGGCFKMRCQSSKCQKKTVFCFLCREILKANQENAHYPNNDNNKPCLKFMEGKK